MTNCPLIHLNIRKDLFIEKNEFQIRKKIHRDFEKKKTKFKNFFYQKKKKTSSESIECENFLNYSLNDIIVSHSDSILSQSENFITSDKKIPG